MAGPFRNDCAALALAAAALSAALPTSAQARTALRSEALSIPQGRLSDALIALSEQAGISIAIPDRDLERVRVPALTGRYTVAQALDRLLRGSGWAYVFVDARTVRLVRKPPTSVPRSAPAARPAPPAEAVGAEIVVSATKQQQGLPTYPASISVVTADRSEMARSGGEGTAFILEKLPTLSSTNLGPGRNKIFIRGVADSSFNGASQSTISQYLGETRLIYSAPDPDLALYDIGRVEVLEGPQGTLYGAGSLGGIIRLVPNPPDLRQRELQLSAGLRTTEHGALGGDGAAIGNLPLIGGVLGLRAVGYRVVEGGYIDDAQRGRRNINRNTIQGARLSLRYRPDPAWKVDASLVVQGITSRDGQYTLRDQPDLTRRSAIAQPFDNDYRLGGVTVHRDWGNVQLVSATGYADHAIDSIFDATPPGASTPVSFTEKTRVQLLSHETRLTGRIRSSGTWLVGVGLSDNHDRVIRRIGPLDAVEPLTNVVNSTLDLAVFGEMSVPLTRWLTLTTGGRFSFVRQASEFAGKRAQENFEPIRTQRRVLPSVALSSKALRGVLFYVRYQEGFRPGSLQVTGDAATRTAERFGADRIGTLEAGMRFGMEAGARLSGSLTISQARWRDVQADLVTPEGFPYTANLGSGRIRNLTAALAWHPWTALSLEAAGYLNTGDLTDPAEGFVSPTDTDLPDIAEAGARLAAAYNRQFAWGKLTVNGAVRYVGQSKLAVAAPFALKQGRYFEATTGMRLGLGAWGVSVDVDNLLDTRANTFAFGNPFSVAQGLQQTPLRPRSLRIGLDASF